MIKDRVWFNSVRNLICGLFSKNTSRDDGKTNHENIIDDDIFDDDTFDTAIDFDKLNAEHEDSDAESQYQYGIMFVLGKDTFPQDNKQAIYWLTKAANKGHMSALAMLGIVYQQNGDTTTAIDCFQKAAAQNNELGCEALALAYGLGNGVPSNQTEAHKWFLKAAKLGGEFPQFIVGIHYLKGMGVEPDGKKALYWFEKAANQGHAEAQFMVGYIFENGLNDLKKAYYWYNLSAKQGFEKAIKRIQGDDTMEITR